MRCRQNDVQTRLSTGKLTISRLFSQPFRRYVSIGRVALVNLAEDPLFGKLVAIVDVVDQNRVRFNAMRRVGFRASRAQWELCQCSDTTEAFNATCHAPPASTAAIGVLTARLLHVLQALIDSPEITRTVINFKRLTLLDFNVEIERTPKKPALIEAFKKAGACCCQYILAVWRLCQAAVQPRALLAAG